MKNRAASINARLKNLAEKENVDFQIILIRYLHERFLYRLSKSGNTNNFFLKGGTLIYAMEGVKTRPTMDIDFLGAHLANDVNILKNVFAEICKIQYFEDCAWFDSSTITAESISENSKYQGIRIYIQSGFDTIRQRLQIDVGFGDIMTPGPKQLYFPVMLEELQAPVIKAYSVETIIAEKFQAMIELSTLNSRMKDFYDVYNLLSKEKVDIVMLDNAIKATFKNRNTIYVDDHSLFSEDFANDKNRQKMWVSFLKKMNIQESLSFADVYKVIKEVLYPIWKTV